MAGPLTGLKVLDLSRILAGPWSTQVLADFGAEVWKIEKPNVGDDTRQWGPPFLKDQQGNDTTESAYYLAANRGKKSIEVDISTERGKSIVLELAAQADIFVENYKVGGLEKYGLHFDAIKASNPGIIYCSITGFGQDGPCANNAGYDAMIQAMGGLMSVTGEKDESPGGGPQKVGVAVADLMTGMYAVSGILAALHHKNKTGKGQHIDIGLLDTQVAWLANQASNYLVSGDVPKRIGAAHPNIVPYQVFKVLDGYIILAVGNDGQFEKCCEVLECPELAYHVDYKTNAVRVQNRASLVALLQDKLLTKSLDEWLAKFAAVNVPCGPINSIDRVFDNPQVKHRQMQFDLFHPTAGKVPQVANPIKFSETKIEYQSAPPTLGQHTDEIINKLGTLK